MSQWDSVINAAAQKYNVDPKLIASVIHVESGGDPSAYRSDTGATGLTQIIPKTAKSLGVDPSTPEGAIEGAAKLLDENLTRYGSPEQAILAYHGGTDQSNWGPKTQDYLRKVSTQYGAPQVAKPSADDFASQDFAGPSVAAPPTMNDFAAQDFAAPVKAMPDTVIPAATPQGGSFMPVANAQTPQQAAPAQPGIAGQAWDALGQLGQIGIGNANAAGRGIMDALDAPAEWLAKGLDKSGLTDYLKTKGVDIGTYDEQVAADKSRRDDYESRTAGGIQQGASRLIGNVIGAAVPVAGLEAGATVAGSRLAGALGNPEALGAAGKFLAGRGGLASRAAYGAEQGAAGGAILSGGQPDGDLGNSMALGALLGGAVPVAGAGIRSAINTVKGAVAPFSAEGRDAIAKKLIQGDAAKAAPKLSSAADDEVAAASGATGAPDVIPAADSASGALSRFAMNGPVKGDFAEYVPGSQPTLAQATGNAGLAQLERTMYNRDVNSFTARQESNTAARQSYLSQIKGTPDTLQAAQEVREQQAIPLLKQAFTDAGKVDSQPVMNTIKGILSGPDKQRDVVQTALNPIIKKLQIKQVSDVNPLIPGTSIPRGMNGNGLEYDVNQMYGIRKSINDQLEKVAGKDNSVAQQASSDLIKVKASIDEAIEKAAPGFKDYLAQYSDLSKPINAQNYLQKVDLTDQTSQGLSLNKVKQLMLKINKDRAAPGASDAKAISDDQMQMLANLHKDLQREANSAKGKGIGSNTAQNLEAGRLIDSLLIPGSGIAGQASSAGVGGILGHAMLGPMGAAPGMYVGNQAASMFNKTVAEKAPDVEARLIDYLLNSKGADVLQSARSATPAMDALMRRAAPVAPSATPAASNNNR